MLQGIKPRRWRQHFCPKLTACASKQLNIPKDLNFRSRTIFLSLIYISTVIEARTTVKVPWRWLCDLHSHTMQYYFCLTSQFRAAFPLVCSHNNSWRKLIRRYFKIWFLSHLITFWNKIKIKTYSRTPDDWDQLLKLIFLWVTFVWHEAGILRILWSDPEPRTYRATDENKADKN